MFTFSRLIVKNLLNFDIISVGYGSNLYKLYYHIMGEKDKNLLNSVFMFQIGCGSFLLL